MFNGGGVAIRGSRRAGTYEPCAHDGIGTTHGGITRGAGSPAANGSRPCASAKASGQRCSHARRHSCSVRVSSFQTAEARHATCSSSPVKCFNTSSDISAGRRASNDSEDSLVSSISRAISSGVGLWRFLLRRREAAEEAARGCRCCAKQASRAPRWRGRGLVAASFPRAGASRESSRTL